MENLFEVFRRSIEQSNADKKYLLEQLAEINKISEALSDYLKDITSNSEGLQQAILGEKDSIKIVLLDQRRYMAQFAKTAKANRKTTRTILKDLKKKTLVYPKFPRKSHS